MSALEAADFQTVEAFETKLTRNRQRISGVCILKWRSLFLHSATRPVNPSWLPVVSLVPPTVASQQDQPREVSSQKVQYLKNGT